MIRLVAIDLDNTLYDWVSYYVPAFEAMVKKLESQADRETLLDAFQRVHREHGTSEYAFALDEVTGLPGSGVDGSESDDVHPTIQAFRGTAERTLMLYPGVRETLAALRTSGIQLAAYTDAMSAYADVRLSQLGIAEFFDELVATENHMVPKTTRAGTSYFPLSHFDATQIARHRVLRADERKPNPAGLRELMSDWSVAPAETLYVGDSLTRDIPMAKAAGVHDVYASYGRSYDPSLWSRLVRITHWDQQDAQRETDTSGGAVSPSHVIESFEELIPLIADLDGANNKIRLKDVA